MSKADEDGQVGQGNSLYAALARTLTRSAALYFSRPVRLFRPSKVTGWMFLQGLAMKSGHTLSPQFISSLIKERGLGVLPRHFLPPLAVNALLGTVLWTTYAETSSILESHLSHPLAISLLSGAVAGGAQAVVAAPTENVRLVLEGANHHTGWSSAWKDVFLSSQESQTPSIRQKLHAAKEVRLWMKEVADMAGRGWNGWGWGFAKDVCGFAVFFSIFELTRRASIPMRDKSLEILESRNAKERTTTNVPRIVHGATLVTGGVFAGLAYEIIGRPWDAARRAIHIEQVTGAIEKASPSTIVKIVKRKIEEDGILSFFSSNGAPATAQDSIPSGYLKRNLYAVLRVLGRVGPWGVGFLVWEAWGPGLSPVTT